jgi:HD superfamily phosphohydrolase YqeK
MQKPKNIEDYLEIDLSEIKPDAPLPFDVHIYFSKNQRIMLLREKGEHLNAELIEKYKARGLNKVWILKDAANLNTEFSPNDFHKMLDLAAIKAGESTAEIWKLSKIDPDFDHGSSVAVLSATLALGLEEKSDEIFSDIFLAGLLHDIGLYKIADRLAKTPWIELKKEDRGPYAEHNSAGIEILQQYSPELHLRVQTILEQHCNTLYDANSLDELTQVVMAADLIFALSSGRWDNNKLTITQAVHRFDELAQAGNLKNYFNPKILSLMQTWTKSVSFAQMIDLEFGQAQARAA